MRAAQTKTRTDTSGIHLWLVLWKAFRSVEAHAHRHIAGLDMCLSDFAVLEVLLHKGPLNVKELGAKVMLTSGSMTAALNRLGRRGLVDREEDAGDRRVRVVRLTEAGTALIREAFEDHKQAMETATAGIGNRDREVLIDLLRRLGLGAVNRLADENARQPRNKGVAVKSGGSRNREE
ncbi:MAG: MarR family transcriptional regulator [Alloacidobacterium sp.]|jgi:MarR family 2-MHQ and catechol resistance regulon transcriptional repressor